MIIIPLFPGSELTGEVAPMDRIIRLLMRLRVWEEKVVGKI
jgi:hypothetical protein